MRFAILYSVFLLWTIVPALSLKAFDLSLERDRLKSSILNLGNRYKDDYDGSAYLKDLESVNSEEGFNKIKKEALLDHPLIRNLSVLMIRTPLAESDAPSEIVRVEVKDAQVAPILSSDEYSGLNLHWDARRMLFAAKLNGGVWNVYESSMDGSNRRPLTSFDDINAFAPRYLPNGDIIFLSDAPVQGSPSLSDNGGKISNLYLLKRNNKKIRRITYDQGDNSGAVISGAGKIIYNRDEYMWKNRKRNRVLMMMDPDGSGQRSIYKRDSVDAWLINETKPLAGTRKLISIVSKKHEDDRYGFLALFDADLMDSGGEAFTIFGDSSGPRFANPEPIDKEYFLLSGIDKEVKGKAVIFIADIFGNYVPLIEDDKYSLVEPVILKSHLEPPIISGNSNLNQDHASVYIQDVYTGPGLTGVKRGVVKSVRVIKYDYAYPSLVGPDRVGISSLEEVVTILGEAKVHSDGSAYFNIPANTAVAFQLLDGDGRAVQVMRSWMTAMPGERVSCIGCHDKSETVLNSRPTMALDRSVQTLKGGSSFGFDFENDIQPIIDQNCFPCHDANASSPNLRAAATNNTSASGSFTTAYENLHAYIRKHGRSGALPILMPAENKADTSALIQLLSSGHGDVELEPEEWRKLYAWIDINAPAHGDWNQVAGVATPEAEIKLREKYSEQFEAKVKVESSSAHPFKKSKSRNKKLRTDAVSSDINLAKFPFDADPNTFEKKSLELGEGESINIIRLPIGEFIMGSDNGYNDEKPKAAVKIAKAYWIAEAEITNKQYRLYDPEHDSGSFSGRMIEAKDIDGISLNDDKQPVLRVSWDEAVAFCKWLSKKTGKKVRLPTEAQWEYACRAGTDTDYFFGTRYADYSSFANVADRSFMNKGLRSNNTQELFILADGVESLYREAFVYADKRFDDGFLVTSPIKSYKPNNFGLYDLSGNVAEWTRSLYKAYPYTDKGRRNDPISSINRVARGGSYIDSPDRVSSSSRYSYPSWQKVHNVGFRIVVEE